MPAPLRRLRRSNSLQDIGRLMGPAGVAHEDRKARFEAHANKLFHTDDNAHGNYFKIQTLNLFLRQYGVQFIANDRVFHIYEDWPGMDRRKVSGSVFSSGVSAKSANVLFPPRIAKRPSGSAAKGYQPGERPLLGWSVFVSGGGIGAAWLDDGLAGSSLRHLKSLAFDRGAPVPFWRQRLKHRDAIRENGQLLGGATPQEKRRATESNQKLNERIVALRGADLGVRAACRDYERSRRLLDALVPGSRKTTWERMVEQRELPTVAKPDDPERRAADMVAARLWHSAWMAYEASKGLASADCGQNMI